MKLLRLTLLFITIAIFLQLFPCTSHALEKLDRGVVAMSTSEGNVYVGWRLLASDPQNVAFDVLRCAEPDGERKKLNNSPIKDSCNFVDTTADGKSWYYVIHPINIGTFLSDSELVKSNPADANDGCIKINLQGDYGANKIGIADLDGDGVYDFVIKQPGMSIDPGRQRRSRDTYKIEAYNGRTGKFMWQKKNGRAWARDYPGTRGTPTIDGGRLYHESPLGNIICLEAKAGDKIWELNILQKFQSKTATWALCESLLIDGNRLICCPGGPQTCMVALDKNTGSIVWKAPGIDELASYGSPILVEYKGLRIIITLASKSIIGVNADNGELLWHVKHESYIGENVMMPIYNDGHVFVSTLKTGSVKWRVNVQNGKASLDELWRTLECDNQHSGVILVNGNLYGTSTFSNRGMWVCLDWETGENKYVDKGVGKGSLTYADGMLYMLGENKVMELAKPTQTGFELISSFEIPEGGEGKSWAHPVVCGGRLYIRHGEFLYAYDVRKNI
ncbi:MAG: PQQ-binding-like beta-propeller repeat protein [Phycisphaerales bacterium]